MREARERQPEWILLDLMLPDGNGADLLRAVKNGDIRSKVCVVTGCGAAMLADVRKMEPDHVFTKPLNVDGLLSVLCR
jgi:DNA-binding response OmpR family regulator